jgi:hypothetical protein
MKDRVERSMRLASFVVTYLIEVGGMIAITIGAGMIYRPAGFIVGGAFAVIAVEVKA